MVDINQRERTIRVKIVYYGPALGGKTTNLSVLHARATTARRGEFISVNSMQDRTILCDLLPLRSGGFRGYDLKLQLLAVPGQAMYSITRRVVLKPADGVVFVANSASDRWYENAQSLKEMSANLIAHQFDPNTIPFVIQYNKRDLPQVIELEALARELNLRHVPEFPAVATRGAGVLETFSAILSVTIQDLCRRYRTMELPPGQSVEAWVKEAVKGMFGGEHLGALPSEAPTREQEEPPVEIELDDGTVRHIAGSGRRRVRVTTPEDAPRASAPAVAAPAPGATPAAVARPAAPSAAATLADALTSSYAEASAELGFVVNDLREERDAALVRLEEMRHALDLATESPGTSEIESRVRRILQVLAGAAGASGATLRLAAGEAARIIALAPLISDPLSRTNWGRAHLDEFHDLPELLVEEAVDSAELMDALRAGEPSFEALVLVPLRSAERVLGLALLYYDLHAVLPSQDTQMHLAFLARELAGPLEASAGREAAAAASRLRALSRASSAAVASLLARLPAESTRRQRLELAGVLDPLRVPGVAVAVPPGTMVVLGDAPLLRFALAALVHLCETDALERGRIPDITIGTGLDGAVVRVTVSGGGRASVHAVPAAGYDASDAELSVVQTIVDLHGGALTIGRGMSERPVFTIQLKGA